MRRRVLVLTRDMIPLPGRPVSGGGLRAWGLGEALRARGHEVLYSVPRSLMPPEGEHEDPAGTRGRAADSSRSAPTGARGPAPELRRLSFELDDLHRTLLKAEPDVVLVEQWGLATYLQDVTVPLVLDLHGSLILENAYRLHRSLTSNAAAKIKALQKADLVICPAVRQRAYFMGWLMMSGADPTDIPIEVVPVSMPPQLPARVHRSDGPLSLVYGGQLWPWIEPERALLAAADLLGETGGGVCHLFVNAPESVDVLPFDSSTQVRSRDLSAGLRDHRAVSVEGLVSHDDLLQRYASADLAVDVYAWNTERELAYTTRTVEYLWCGLPVISANYGELAQLIGQYEAGWLVDPGDDDAVRAAVRTALQDRDELRRRSENAQRLVRERLTWDQTVGPLEAFVRDPVVRQKGATIFGKLALEFDRIDGETRLALRQSETRISDLQQEVAARDRRIIELSDELSRRDRRYTELMERHGRESALWDGERRKMEREMEEVRGDAQRTHGDLQEVKQQLRCEQDDHTQTSTRLETTQSDATLAQRRVEEKEAQVAQLRADLKGAALRIGNDRASHEARVESLECRLREVSQRELTVRSDVAAEAAQADTLREEVGQLRKQLEQMQRRLQQAQQMASRLKDHWVQRGVATGQHSLRRVAAQVPALAGLFVRNLANNAYMTIWQKRHNVRIFPGQ